MNIITYNVNGIRAAFGKDLSKWLASAAPDMLCIQETKAQPEQINCEIFTTLGYETRWFSAKKKGYSGVGIATKFKPKNVEYGFGIKEFDDEGRVLRLDFEDFSLISVYVPSATNIERLDFKMQFCYDFSDFIENLSKTIPNLIICGDFNICHEAIDIHDPVRLANVSGFLPIEREWMSDFMNRCGLIDSFRKINPNKIQYSWWSYRANARNNNKGWRLDYNFVTKPLENKISRAVILQEAKHSDHCPTLVDLKL